MMRGTLNPGERHVETGFRPLQVLKEVDAIKQQDPGNPHFAVEGRGFIDHGIQVRGVPRLDRFAEEGHCKDGHPEAL